MLFLVGAPKRSRLNNFDPNFGYNHQPQGFTGGNGSGRGFNPVNAGAFQFANRGFGGGFARSFGGQFK